MKTRNLLQPFLDFFGTKSAIFIDRIDGASRLSENCFFFGNFRPIMHPNGDNFQIKTENMS